MKIIAASALLISLSALGASGSLSYTTGAYKNKDMVQNPAHFGYDEICFKGNPYSARNVLYKFMADNYELENVFARYEAKNNVIVYGYVNTKCTDEMANEYEDCRSFRTAPLCK